MAQQDHNEGCMQHQPPATSAHTSSKPRARQVTSRYLQPKPQGMGAASSQLASSGPLTGRPSLAAYGSTGWVELQHPNHASTPLMVPHGSAGPSVYSTVKGKARSGMPLPTPAPTAQKHQQQFITPAPAATPRMGLSRQQALQTPRGLSMSAAPSRCAGPGDRPGVFSADLTGAVTQPRLAGEGDMRAKLSAWREMKQQQGSRTAAKAGVFKEPAPKPTLFRGTAATRLNKEPSSGKKAVSSVGTAKPGAAERSSSVAAAAASRGAAATVTSPTASSTTGSSVAPTAGSVASPSAFSATMATLQGSGGKPRPGRPSSSKAGSGKPSPVPLLRLGQAGLGLGSPAASSQHQQQHDPSESFSPLPAVGSSTKIPRLNLSSLTSTPQPQQTYRHRQQLSSRGQQHGPMSSRGPSSSGGEPALPDATPRTARDALPSRVPRTPRTATPAGHSQQQSRRSSTSDGNDRALGQLDTLKSVAEQASRRLSPQSSAAKPAVPKLKLGALLGETSPGPAAATAAAAHHARPAAAGGHSCLSARGPAATIRGAAAAAHGTPTAPIRTSSDGGCTGGTPVQQHGRTPRGPAPAPTAAGRLPTPRSLTSSMAAAAAGPAGAAPAAKKAEADKVEDVRQELRLLRMQQLQLRHLNARMEAALQAKREKMEAQVAAAAAAVADLSGRLLKANHQAQQSSWQSELAAVLQQQHSKLQAWAQAQAQHQANINQLQTACNTALSHVPLLNGATVGHDPEQPDLQALQRQLQHGMQLLAELQPAVQLLMTGDPPSTSSSSSSAAHRSAASSSSDVHLHPKGIKDTAALSRDLMKVADEECLLLQQITQQLEELSELQLYVNSMHVQLQVMRQPQVEECF